MLLRDEEAERKGEREPHYYRCTSPQFIALCVAVSSLYSTPDKICHCMKLLMTTNQTRPDVYVCLNHDFHATSYATLMSQKLRKL